MPEQRVFPPEIALVSQRIAERLGVRAYPRTTPEGDWIIEVVANELSLRDKAILGEEAGTFVVQVVDPAHRSIVARPGSAD